jgi:hypothetical protein
MMSHTIHEDHLPINYIFIDFENLQPKNLELLKNHPSQIYVFMGENQTKVPIDLAAAMQAFGEDARYIKISGNGKNSLDFHIAYYIGKLSLEDTNGSFHIISKDTGFDPLIKHLRDNKIHVYREKDLTEIPLLQISNTATEIDKIDAIIKNLVSMGQSRPRKVKTLSNTINSLFTKKLDDKELELLINKLKERQHITLDQGKVTYKLPNRP